jgi:2-C-methyl-D-erythritol 4-phosphate cytidylyltransferase
MRGGTVKSTPDREELFSAQTPQVFITDLLKTALQNAINKGIPVTDDSSAVEALGMTVRISKGSYENIKITTPSDLTFAAAILESREGS